MSVKEGEREIEREVEIPSAQIIYGNVIYWTCVIAAIICTIGPAIAVASADNNVLNPHYLFAAIFEGNDPAEVWETAGPGFPGPHFYFKHITWGDGITMFGIAMGCACALWALIAAAIGGYLREKPRNYLYAAFCFWIAFIIYYAAGIGTK